MWALSTPPSKRPRLPLLQLELTPAMAARSQLDIIFAAGPVSRRTGGLLQHSQYGSARLGLEDGSISAVEVLAR